MSDDVVTSAPAPRSAVSNGAFATMPAHDLGAIAIKAARSAGIEPARIQVIMGQILTAAQAKPRPSGPIAAGIPGKARHGASTRVVGPRTVALGYQGAAQRRSEIVVAGGQNP